MIAFVMVPKLAWMPPAIDALIPMTAIRHLKCFRIHNGMPICSQPCVQVQHLLHVAIECKSCKTVQTISRRLPSIKLQTIWASRKQSFFS
jgi:hypothetical protein